jgi:hypothetical protein
MDFPRIVSDFSGDSVPPLFVLVMVYLVIVMSTVMYLVAGAVI